MSLKFSEIGMIIGYIIVVLAFFYFVGLAVNTPNIVEGLSARAVKEQMLTPAGLAEAMEDLNSSLKDEMNITKNRAAYQDALAQIQENVNLSILQTLSNSQEAIPTDDELDKIHKYKNYKDTVIELEEFLDGVKD
jgi:hypothetical protein